MFYDYQHCLRLTNATFASILLFSTKCFYAPGFFGVKVIVCRAFLAAAAVTRARSRSPTGPTE